MSRGKRKHLLKLINGRVSWLQIWPELAYYSKTYKVKNGKAKRHG